MGSQSPLASRQMLKRGRRERKEAQAAEHGRRGLRFWGVPPAIWGLAAPTCPSVPLATAPFQLPSVSLRGSSPRAGATDQAVFLRRRV